MLGNANRIKAGDFRFKPLRARQTPPIKRAVHGAIYEWVRERTAGADVLDVGCAEGFGAALLAERARSVVGIDWDSDLVAVAERDHRRHNLRFETADAQCPHAREAYDVVVVNALVEHVGDVDATMLHAVEALRPGGLLVCGTKNSATSFKRSDGSPLYDNHLREYTAASLTHLLQRYLSDVTTHLLMMRPRAERALMSATAVGAEGLLVRLGVKGFVPLPLRRRVRALITGVALEELAPEDFFVVRASSLAAAGRAAYVVALGHKPESLD